MMTVLTDPMRNFAPQILQDPHADTMNGCALLVISASPNHFIAMVKLIAKIKVMKLDAVS